MESTLFAAAARALAATAGTAVLTDRLQERLPADSMPGGEPPTVREALQGVAYDLVFVPHTLSGRALDDAPPATAGEDLLGDDPAASLQQLAERAVEAVAGHGDAGSTTHLTYGEHPARDYVRDITGYYGMLAVDLAGLTGTEPSADLVEGLYAHLEPVADDWRAIGVFGARVPVDDSAPLLDRLRGLTGRRP